MKKALSLILALVLCLSLCACGGETKSNEIELTAENFETYVRIERRKVNTDTMSDGSYRSAYAALDLNGASTNYNYNNVSITYKVINTWNCPDHEHKFETTVTAKTDISGYCSTGEKIPVSSLYCKDHKDRRAKPGNFRWELVSVTGTLTPAG